MAEIVLIETDKLLPHPKNPRLIIREDVVNGIVAGIESGFHPSHALQVWPIEDCYYILSGHHRLEAAKRKKIKELPCWVRLDLNEDEAFMLLATDNNQGELSPLEIGMHALNYVETSNGGRGQKGGLSEYARQVGRSKQILQLYRDAATVVSKLSTQVDGLLDKAKHLSFIHSLPESTWKEAVDLMLKKEWSAADTQKQVQASKQGQTEKQVGALFLGKTSLREIQRISELKASIYKSLEYEDTKQQWLDWHIENDPIDVKEVQLKRTELEDIEAERKAEERENLSRQQQIEEELEKQKLPSLVLADPPWKYAFSETDSRQIENQYPSATVDEIISHKPETQPDCVLFLWATVAKLQEALEVMNGWGFTYKTNAVWNKEKIGMGYWFRGQHELLLVGTKGKASPPDTAKRVSSVFNEPRRKHSEKPECVYSWIENAFPTCKKLEMYCRNKRDDWMTWGNEA